ncbi:MAG: cysteine desulfurase family protein [Pirellulaceae bacterium]
MSQQAIYLDHNSTTPIDPRVVEAMVRAWTDSGANPASQHVAGRKARRMLEEAREGIAELLGAKTGGMDADRLIFTSGGTEANNLALCGLMPLPIAGSKLAPGAALAISAIEHPSITATADDLRRTGCALEVLKANKAGIIAWQGLARQEPHAPALASLMLANNETGVIQPVETFAAQCRERGLISHTDAVQAVGKIPVHFRELGVDAMTLAPHKFHGPLGIGALVLRHGVKLQPQLFGGFQQEGLRPGTENVALAVGFFQALELAVRELPQRAERMQTLRDQLERSIQNEFPAAVVIGHDAPRLPNTSCLAFPGVDRQQLVMALDVAGIACSTGSACASGSSEPSPVLLAMGLPAAVIAGAIRLSLGASTTAVEIAEAARRIVNTVKHLRSLK